MIDQDTICTISTPPGTGGIAVVRVSGPMALTIADRIFTPAQHDKRLKDQPANTFAYGTIHDDETIVDEVIASVFRAPHSFTGEDTVEISCHGSIYIQQQILRLLIENGCRSARPGEYTQRAFMNGKMDLSQAEAVADLIASTSAGMHRLAISQMRGGFSDELIKLRAQLLNFTSLIELELDFSEEEVEFADREQLKLLANEIEGVISRLADSFRVGNAVKNGIPVVIAGETNAGKSSLLNLLVGEERAIVSDIHGTTRDVIEDTITLEGITFRFIDTAGIRETTSVIENLGIDRTFQKIGQAQIVLWVIDLTTPEEKIKALAEHIKPKIEEKKTILVFNKKDLLSEEEFQAKQTLLEEIEADRIYISAKKKKNIEALQTLLQKAAAIPEIGQNDIIVTNIRHYEALTNALQSIRRVKEGLDNQISGDFLSQDIRECIHDIGEITGQITSQEVLNNIFGRFCIGK